MKPDLVLKILLTFFLVLSASLLPAAEPAVRKNIRVGIFPLDPINYFDENGVARGLHVDLLQEMTKGGKWQLEFVPVTWGEGLERLQRQEIDIMVSVAFTLERARTMEYSSVSVLELWGQIFLPARENSRNINDLDGKRVAVMAKDINADNFIRTAEQFGVHCQILTYATYPEVFAAVRKGSADAGVAAQHYGLRHAGNYNLVGSSILFNPISIFYAAKKGTQSEFLNHVDTQLGKWKRDKNSFYYQRLNYWLGNAAGSEKILPWMLYGSLALLATAIVCGGLALVFRRTVQRRTRELQESEEKYRLLIENAGEAIYVVQDGLLQYVNARAAEISGYAREELLQRNVVHFIHPDDRFSVMRQYQRRRKGSPGLTRMTYRMLPKSGESRWAELNVIDIQWAGRPALLNFLTDITEWKLAEEKKREADRLLQSVLEGTTDAIFVKDRQGHYLLANRGTCEALGKSLAEIIGRTDTDLFPADLAGIIADMDQKVMTSGQAVMDEIRIETAAGTSHWLTNKSPLLNEAREVVGVLGIARDITSFKRIEEERKTLERQLIQAQKIEAIGTLAGGIAHDFNNILGAILGHAEMAIDACDPGSSAADDLDQIIRAGLRAKDLVRQILSYSRQSGSEPSLINLAGSIDEAIKLLRPSLPATIEIRQNIDPEVGLVLADPSQIHQILVNLCTNAYHAMEEHGGTLTVGLRQIELFWEDLVAEPQIAPGIFACLSVQDTGQGITPEIRSRIFDPYFTTKEMGKGTGLGLAIVHGLVKSHAGFISCCSEPGEGTVFHVFLPVKQATVTTGVVQAGPVIGGDERLLFVDDETMLAEISRTMLQRLGYQVTIETNSLSALATFRQNPGGFDIVITDQTMPGMTGLEMAGQMLAIRPDLPIILCTGFSNLVSAEKARAAGIRAFALKPLARKEIAGLIRKVLAKEEGEG